MVLAHMPMDLSNNIMDFSTKTMDFSNETMDFSNNTMDFSNINMDLSNKNMDLFNITMNFSNTSMDLTNPSVHDPMPLIKSSPLQNQIMLTSGGFIPIQNPFGTEKKLFKKKKKFKITTQAPPKGPWKESGKSYFSQQQYTVN